ncbi:MAG: hypothetical protein JXA22_04740 [Candidatus Thermoplasmatota archaeon]|nr:hypothetical protein [Candidatus Thermoplasmatota archaeon]
MSDSEKGKAVSDEASVWYLDTFLGNLDIKDDASRKQIFLHMRSMVMKASSGTMSRKELIDILGDPAILAGEISTPSNWVIDLGTPIFPKTEIDPFFSRGGRVMLILMFIFALSLSMGMFIVHPDIGWSFPGLLLVFIVIWALGLSFLNSYLGYLGTSHRLKRTGLTISSIGYGDVRRNAIFFFLISFFVSLISGTIFVLIDTSLLSISLPISISTIAASVIASRMMIIEGGKVLRGT